jgi:hypothetical protein
MNFSSSICTAYPIHCIRFGSVALQEYKLHVESSLLCSILHPCYFPPCRSRCSQYHIFKHLRSLFFPFVEGASVAQCQAAGNIVVLPINVNTIVYLKCVLCVFPNVVGRNICLLLIKLIFFSCVFRNVRCHTSSVSSLSKIGITPLPHQYFVFLVGVSCRHSYAIMFKYRINSMYVLNHVMLSIIYVSDLICLNRCLFIASLSSERQ